MDLAILDLLRKAESEIEAGGRISDELKREMVSKGKRLQKVWLLGERIVRDFTDAKQIDFEVAREIRRASANPDYGNTFSVTRSDTVFSVSRSRIESALKGGAKGAYDNVAVPSAEARAEFSARKLRPSQPSTVQSTDSSVCSDAASGNRYLLPVTVRLTR